MKRREEEKQKRQEVAQSIRRTRRRSSTLALEYQVRFEEGQDKAEQIFVSLCLFLIQKVPSHGLDLQQLETGLADGSEATRLLTKAVEINEKRKDIWNVFYNSIDSWKRDDSVKENELFESILKHRPDLHAAVLQREDNESAKTAKQKQLERDIESFYSRIRQSFVRPNDHQKDMDDLAREVERVQTEYSVIIDS